MVQMLCRFQNQFEKQVLPQNNWWKNTKYCSFDTALLPTNRRGTIHKSGNADISLGTLSPFWHKHAAKPGNFEHVCIRFSCKARLVSRVCARKSRRVKSVWNTQSTWDGWDLEIRDLSDWRICIFLSVLKETSHFSFPKGQKTFSNPKKLLLGAVSLELPFFLSYVTPRPILETRCFVLGFHLQHFCSQQTAISLLFDYWGMRIPLGSTFRSLQAKGIKI